MEAREVQPESRIIKLGRRFPVVFVGAFVLSFLSWSLSYLSPDTGWPIGAAVILFCLFTMLMGSYSQIRGLSAVWWFGSLLGLIPISPVWQYFNVGSSGPFTNDVWGIGQFISILYLTPPTILMFYLFASYNSERITTPQKQVNWFYLWNFFSPMNKKEEEQKKDVIYKVPPLGWLHNSFMGFFYQNPLNKLFALVMVNAVLLILVIFLY